VSKVHSIDYNLADVLDWLKPLAGRVVNSDLATRAVQISKPAELGLARETDIAFFFSRNYQADLLTAHPGILVTGEPFVPALLASGLPLLREAAIIACSDPYLGMALCLEKLALPLSSVVHLSSVKDASVATEVVNSRVSKAEVHSSVVIGSDVELGEGVSVGAFSVIESNARIGTGSVIYPGCYIGPSVVVGEDTVLFSGVKLYEKTVLGARVRIHAGAVLGADGFGYAPSYESPAGSAEAKRLVHRKIFHLGRVVVGDDVEIGANSCIDRGTLGDTRIDRGAKIDDLVMIGHNCWIEEGAILCGKAGLAGRARVGKYAMIGGAAGLSNDVHVGDRARVAGHCLVSKDVPAGMTVVGNPQREHKEHFLIQAMLNRMLKKGRNENSSHRNR
jgi:UDP-3-O-[3-hydroxymyristoyl] glucosamine N-acyltransferase